MKFNEIKLRLFPSYRHLKEAIRTGEAPKQWVDDCDEYGNPPSLEKLKRLHPEWFE